MPVGRCEQFVNNNDLKYLHISTENKNIRKNTNWSVTTLNDWHFARMTMTGDQIPDILASVEKLNFWLSRFKRDAKMARPILLKHFTFCVLDF